MYKLVKEMNFPDLFGFAAPCRMVSPDTEIVFLQNRKEVVLRDMRLSSGIVIVTVDDKLKRTQIPLPPIYFRHRYNCYRPPSVMGSAAYFLVRGEKGGSLVRFCDNNYTVRDIDADSVLCQLKSCGASSLLVCAVDENAVEKGILCLDALSGEIKWTFAPKRMNFRLVQYCDMGNGHIAVLGGYAVPPTQSIGRAYIHTIYILDYDGAIIEKIAIGKETILAERIIAGLIEMSQISNTAIFFRKYGIFDFDENRRNALAVLDLADGKMNRIPFAGKTLKSAVLSSEKEFCCIVAATDNERATIQKIGVPAGNLMWSIEENEDIICKPIISNEGALVYSRRTPGGGELVIIEADSGKTVESIPLKRRVHSLLQTQNHLYVCSFTGKMDPLDAKLRLSVFR